MSGDSHLPPQDLAAEEAVLGAMIGSSSAIRIVLEVGIAAEDFYRPSHRVVFGAIMECFDAGAVDELTVITRLKAMRVKDVASGKELPALEAAGGSVAILTFYERCPAVSNAKAYAQRVLDVASRRGIVEAGHEVARLGYDDAVSPDAAAEAAEQLLHRVTVRASSKHERGDSFDGGESLDRWGAEYAATQEDPEEYRRRTLSWGRDELDERVGRMEAGDVFVISGWTKHGKTWQVLDVAEAALDQGARVLIHSMEMNDKAVTSRLVAMGGHDHDAVRERRVPWGVLQPRMRQMRGWDRRTVQGKTTVARIRGQVARARLEGRPFRMLVVDHLGLLRPDPGARYASRREFVEDVCSDLKAIAEEYELVLLLVAQLSRPQPVSGTHPEFKRQPVSTDLKEASGIEQIATSIVFIYRHMDKESGRQLADRSARVTFPFHRHKVQPRPLEVVFTVPRGDAASAYRFAPAEAAETSVEVVRAVEAIQQAFGPGVTAVPADDGIPF